MTVNNFFQNNYGASNEQDLTEDLIIESIQIQGRDYFYIPRNTNNIDNVLNEIPNSSFQQFAVVEMYMNNFNDLAANNLLVSQFGLSAINTAEFTVSRKRFIQSIQNLPLVGDLIFDDLSRTLWEIDYVDSEPQPSYQLQKLYTYTLKCNLFTYSYEKFQTNIQSVDTDLNNSTFVDSFAKDQFIEDEAELDIDTSEDNPLGEEL